MAGNREYISGSASTQRIQYIMSFPEPDTPGTFYFSGLDIMDFLSQFHRLGKKHGINDAELINMLLNYYK